MNHTTVWHPELIAQLRAFVAMGLSDPKIAIKLGITRNAVNSARKRFGIQSSYQHESDVPADFAERAVKMTMDGLCKLYHAGRPTVAKWCKAVGVTPVATTQTKAQKRTKPKHARTVWGSAPQAMVPTVDPTIEGQAARHLQRFFVPVHRLRTIKPSAPADMWIVGRNQMPVHEMLALAGKKGFTCAL